MTALFDIDTKGIVEYTNKLEKMHKSSLPVSVRGALNDAAFDMNKRTLPEEFNEEFTIRSKSFLRSHTFTNKSPNTFDIEKMHASTGIIKGKSVSGDNLEKQEIGGKISNRGAIPYDTTRIGSSHAKKMRKVYYYKKFKNAKLGRVSKTKQETIIRTKRSLLRVKRGGVWDVLYTIKDNVNLPRSLFVTPAGRRSAKLIPDFYVKQAERRIKK